jgi:phage tail-like protein
MAANLPHPSFQFQVEAGFTRIGFARVQLPRMERDVILYREGADRSDVVRQLPGLLRLGDCLLERGVMPPDNEFFRWVTTAGVGGVERRDMVVKLLDAKHQPTMVWHLRNTFPVALKWSVLDAQSSSVLIETLRLSAEAMEVETV